MYKVIILSVMCFAIISCAPTTNDSVQVLRYDREFTEDGGYKFGYETSDGQRRDEEGFVKISEDGVKSLVVYGSYSYIGPDGITYTVEYISDENGFRPIGEHIPGSRGHQL